MHNIENIDLARDYDAELDQLTFNSKPIINSLTIIADENIQNAADIVALIERRIAENSSTTKLPILYLQDSILKNVGKNYITIFSKNIVSSFSSAFAQVDENTQTSLLHLLQTWKDSQLFPAHILAQLEAKVKGVKKGHAEPTPPSLPTPVPPPQKRAMPTSQPQPTQPQLPPTLPTKAPVPSQPARVSPQPAQRAPASVSPPSATKNPSPVLPVRTQTPATQPTKNPSLPQTQTKRETQNPQQQSANSRVHVNPRFLQRTDSGKTTPQERNNRQEPVGVINFNHHIMLCCYSLRFNVENR